MISLMFWGALLFGLYIYSRRKEKLSVYFTEVYLKIDKPIPICGTPDVVWINQDGVLIVGDFKSRTNCQVRDSDKIQLSVYKILLEHTQRRPVSNKGYVVFKNGHRETVQLLDERAIIVLYDKYQKIISSKCKAGCTDKTGYCQYCNYLDIC